MKKLTEQRGASILMALLMVLLAAVVSAVILTAAVGAARQLRIDREAQQNYLTVSSAAELVRESILADSYVRTVTVERDETGAERSSDTWIQSPDGLLGPWLSRGIDNRGNCTAAIYLQVEENEEIGRVKLAFSMSDYSVSVVLSLADVSGAADDCRMTLRLDGTSNTSESTVSGTKGTSLTTTTWTVRWSGGSVEKGG